MRFAVCRTTSDRELSRRISLPRVERYDKLREERGRERVCVHTTIATTSITAAWMREQLHITIHIHIQ